MARKLNNEPPASESPRARAVRLRDSVEFIKHPEWWSYWPKTLPLEKNNGELGFMLHIDGEPQFRVRLGNMFARNFFGAQFKDYDSAEAIVADGWRVD
jgi:hypothetical protein